MMQGSPQKPKEEQNNVDGESDVVTTASWRERPKEEQNNVDGESDVVTTASWRERPKEEQNNVDGESDVSDHCIMTGEAERRTK